MSIANTMATIFKADFLLIFIPPFSTGNAYSGLPLMLLYRQSCRKGKCAIPSQKIERDG